MYFITTLLYNDIGITTLSNSEEVLLHDGDRYYWHVMHCYFFLALALRGSDTELGPASVTELGLARAGATRLGPAGASRLGPAGATRLGLAGTEPGSASATKLGLAGTELGSAIGTGPLFHAWI